MSKKIIELKGSFLKHWLRYWKNLYIDYKDVANSIYEHSTTHPIRTAVYLTFSGTSYYLSQHNPNEVIFKDQLMKSTQKLLLVGGPVQNPKSIHYVKWLEQCHNERIIRKINFGIFSLLWIDKYDNDCNLYKTVCPYLRPPWSTFHERLIDFGLLDTWWILKSHMINYDVNNLEFI
ncbi:mitochondrial import inner membrane translocase subunit Tim29 [Phymastichus coffea]|uniref:mitochondrial import inner membrane translocase subunit Tim29 n=1 Tax=Phymastichus coffea TaxID=108790 RepID=UPI00273ACCFE|nr:mitochondrial import inner membrane translocase subunit Tim29 [Phymastichus coffea]